MTYIPTLKRQLVFVGTAFPQSLIEATSHAVEIGAVEIKHGGMSSRQILQGLTACRPELLDWLTMLVIRDARDEPRGMIFLEGDPDALFVFRIGPETASSNDDGKKLQQGLERLNS